MSKASDIQKLREREGLTFTEARELWEKGHPAPTAYTPADLVAESLAKAIECHASGLCAPRRNTLCDRCEAARMLRGLSQKVERLTSSRDEELERAHYEIGDECAMFLKPSSKSGFDTLTILDGDTKLKLRITKEARESLVAILHGDAE
jgi:hypothetical protein